MTKPIAEYQYLLTCPECGGGISMYSEKMLTRAQVLEIEARAEVINLAEALAEKENLLANALAERDEAKAEIVRLNKELFDIAPGVVNDGVKIFEQKRLIEQMREALKSAEVVVDFYEANNNGAGRGIGKMIKAALAAERGE